VEINDNVPFFTDAEMTTSSYEFYSELDSFGRCGVCMASIGTDLMPTEERGTIGDVKPSGWHTIKYTGIVDGNYLYNRCHLIAYELTGENANVKNLITGTRYMNINGMLPFENMTTDYVKETGNHVMYRVTPIFEGANLVASGVLMEAKSVEDNGEGLMFNVFCYNVQPGIVIDYATGDSETDGTFVASAEGGDEKSDYIGEYSETSQENSSQESATKGDMSATESVQQDEETTATGIYAVNANNGKIHIIGACSATKSGSNSMKNPVYFDTYEEALAYSERVAPSQSKRNCGSCW
jgi:DNA-entry nuclease